MGRSKITMELIKAEKARKNTFIKRKISLLKKSYEISILCDVSVCIIIYPYKEGKHQQQEAEVYSFKGGAGMGLIHPSDDDLGSNEAIRDPKVAWEIIERYLRVPTEERNKKARCVNLYDIFVDRTKKAEKELTKLRHKNALAKYPSCISNSNEFSVDQLMKLVAPLDQKIEFIKKRIDMIKDANHNQVAEVATTTTAMTGLVPFFEPTPVSNFMNPSETITGYRYQMGNPEFEGFNRFPLFNYPIINNIDDPNQEYYYQKLSFNSQNALFPHHQVVGATDMEGHGRSSNNLVMYNMMTGGVGPMYYDQRSGGVDNAAATSSYGGGGFPMSMPLQLPMLQPPNNVSLPLQRQYEIFYK